MLLPLLLAAAALAGCGVAFGPAPQGNEFFKSLEVTGDLRVGAPLTAALEYAQRNPIEVTVQCELRQKKELVKVIGGERVAPLPEGDPEATPFPGNYAFDFTVDEPGRYRVECLTPLDEDNYIIEEFTIEPAATPPTP